eukprot:TRINITY_DN3478_c0_g1_i1.p2 TRINITY_DN3478_c0_g1~~TRINITY_DN3478_c0_g1_i1.p2  ORF type:complete len:264 (+),score=19.41 TRINITY_DN3478_c0_g1_i1:61-852(+)
MGNSQKKEKRSKPSDSKPSTSTSRSTTSSSHHTSKPSSTSSRQPDSGSSHSGSSGGKAQHKALTQLFEKYKQIGVEAGAADDEDVMQGEALVALCTDLDINVEDPVILMIAYKLNASAPYQISRSEFIEGLQQLGCDSLPALKGQIPNFRNQLSNPKSANYKAFYSFAFDFSRSDRQTKVLNNEVAAELWRMLLPQSSPHLETWHTFIVDKYKKAVNKDLWVQTIDFFNCINDDISNYDVDGAWPVCLDEFVDYCKKGKEGQP